MPPLLTPSPAVLDNSFPRDREALRVALEAVGQLEELLGAGAVHLLLPSTFNSYLDNFEWSPPQPYALLQELHGLLTQWSLQPHEGIHWLEHIPSSGERKHPLPDFVGASLLSDYWAEEMGALVPLHDSTTEMPKYYIGVASDPAFSGSALGQYVDPPQRCFPLVGPNEIALLLDAYHRPSRGGALPPVSVAQAHANIHLLGATSIRKPRRGSHYSITFPKAARPWVLDPNDDPVPDGYLDQLIPLTGYNGHVIRRTLIDGELPPSTFRLGGACRHSVCKG